MREIAVQRILVTGCGGDIGQSIGKILRLEYPNIEIFGCDIQSKHAGHFIYKECKTVSRVDSTQYIDDVSKLIDAYSPDLIIPTSEAELRSFAKHRMTELCGVPLLMPSFLAMDIGNDKLRTQQFLIEQKLPHAWTQFVGAGRPPEFPCILKDVEGRGAKSVELVQEENYQDFAHFPPHFIFQEYLLPDDEEYTCGLFRSSKGEIRSIALKRSLFQGYTGYAEVVENASITELLEKMALALDLRGCINVQLRLTEKKGPVVFEINARFSSTVLFRNMLGFKGLKWCLQDFLGSEIASYEKPQSGTEIFKGWQEYVLNPQGEKFTLDGVSGAIKKIES